MIWKKNGLSRNIEASFCVKKNGTNIGIKIANINANTHNPNQPRKKRTNECFLDIFSF
jgi:hypothetical protein